MPMKEDAEGIAAKESLLLGSIVHLRPASDSYDLRCLVIMFRSYIAAPLTPCIVGDLALLQNGTSCRLFQAFIVMHIIAPTRRQCQDWGTERRGGDHVEEHISATAYTSPKRAQFQASAQLAYCHASRIYHSKVVWCGVRPCRS